MTPQQQAPSIPHSTHTTGRWAKGVVEWLHEDIAYLSVVFSWHADAAYERAVWYKSQGYTVRVGGPAVHVMGKHLQDVAETGGHVPDAVARHNPMATYASRGCPVACWFCIVPSLEGRTFTLLDDFPVRPVLCDNNLSGLPVDYQNHIVSRYLAENVPLLDAQSGFEPKTFDRDTYERWRAVNKGPWRLAFDDLQEEDDVRRAMAVLRPIRPARTRIYVLVGNEPVDACLHRIHRVLEWGGEPHVQPLIKLNARHKTPWVRHDWTRRKLLAVARWANRRIWRSVPFEKYHRNFKAPSHLHGQFHLELPHP